jgi:3-hydroxymyristoyl/3-hydroxydecanoyl-(acyl carrier protein) dehydratase
MPSPLMPHAGDVTMWLQYAALPQAISPAVSTSSGKARFRKPVMPGNQLLLCAYLKCSAKDALHFSTLAFVGDTEVASAEMVIAQAMDH